MRYIYFDELREPFTYDGLLESAGRRARRRVAQLRIDHLNEVRDIGLLLRAGASRREISGATNLSVRRVRRSASVLKSWADEGRSPLDQTVEELILRAYVDGSLDEPKVVGRLLEMLRLAGGMPGEPGLRGSSLQGGWDELRTARIEGFLTAQQLEAIEAAAT